jgi:hypothetical protein
MTQSEINERLIQVAAGKRTHPHYGRTVALAKRYRALATGDGIEAYMKTYSRREDKELFKARCEITSQITPSIISNLFAGTEKAFRSHYRRELGYGDGEGADIKTAEFEAMLAKYAGGMGVDGFLKERMLELNAQTLTPGLCKNGRILTITSIMPTCTHLRHRLKWPSISSLSAATFSI